MQITAAATNVVTEVLDKDLTQGKERGTKTVEEKDRASTTEGKRETEERERGGQATIKSKRTLSLTSNYFLFIKIKKDRKNKKADVSLIAKSRSGAIKAEAQLFLETEFDEAKSFLLQFFFSLSAATWKKLKCQEQDEKGCCQMNHWKEDKQTWNAWKLEVVHQH